jgi:hypothetical protein
VGLWGQRSIQLYAQDMLRISDLIHIYSFGINASQIGNMDKLAEDVQYIISIASLSVCDSMVL